MSNDARYDAMVFEAVSTINDENGSNLKEILRFIEGQHEVPQNFKKLLSYSLGILVSQDKLKKVRNRYKISVTKAIKPTLTLRPKDSTKPPELPSTSVILTSKETHEIDPAANREAEGMNELAKENNVILLLLITCCSSNLQYHSNKRYDPLWLINFKTGTRSNKTLGCF
jgi:myb proto-oncogene protein|nr:hypothetical protein [Arabidopsis thaliana]